MIIFDGSTRQGEAIAVIVRFIHDTWNITQRFIQIDICSKSVNSEGLARVLNETLCIEFGIRGKLLLAAIEGWGKCESSGIESDGIHLSRDAERYLLFPHTR